MQPYVGPDPVTFKGPAVRVRTNAHHHGEVIGTLQEESRADAESLPFVVTNTFGAGKVVYLGAGFDAAYDLYPYPYQRLILKHAIQRSANSPRANHRRSSALRSLHGNPPNSRKPQPGDPSTARNLTCLFNQFQSQTKRVGDGFDIR